MESLKIYLGDLTYDTVTVANEVFPLNVGFVASYCIAKFGSKVDIILFKYIDELEKAIHDSPPDIMGLSNYCWNKRIGKEMFKILSQENPHALTVWGGPNFPADMSSQQKFMDENTEVDIYVPIDGETGFSNIVKKALESNSKENIKNNILDSLIEGCISRKKDGNLQFNIPVIRINNLDEIPSPYEMGLMDKFFDGKLSPMTQTNRGCPFSCTFCTDGSDSVKQINRFSLERVKSDLDYIVKKVPTNTHSLYVSDLNFGMYPRDKEICRYISEIKKQYNYPLQIQTNTGKNSKEKIIDAIKQLDGSLQILMSVQSTDSKVLTNVRRDNISVDQMMALAPAIKESNLRTLCEVIIGLPGETYESHINTLRDLVHARIDGIMAYTCMMLDGSEMNIPEHREKWGLQTKFRILPKDFTKLDSGKVVLEIEECVIGSKTLTFDQYVELRLLAFILWITNIGIAYDGILKFLRENNIDVFELFYQILKNENNSHSKVKNAFKSYRDATIDELWDSPKDIEDYFQNEVEYEKLLRGEAGINVLQYHRALVTDECMDEWTEYVIQTAYSLIKQSKQFTNKLEEQFLDISNFCRGLIHNTLGKDRMLTNKEFQFNYDIQKWLDDENLTLNNFKLLKPHKLIFKLSENQVSVVKDELEKFGETTIGKGQALKQIPLHILWRHPVLIN
jgi:radical SAM superfamily enzyme YgiQ (UPF0313 family)